LLTDFVQQSAFFFIAPEALDTEAVKPKWNEEKKNFFESFAEKIKKSPTDAITLETVFKETAAEKI
jgi:glutamyl-tRNA synthetase